MTPIDQEFISDHANNIFGDCQRACIACILDLPLKDVPHFLESGDSLKFHRGIQEFLSKFGLFHFEVAYPDFDKLKFLGMPDTCHMIYGASERGLLHAVVGLNGDIIHDPHPSKSGLVESKKSEWTVGFLAKIL